MARRKEIDREKILDIAYKLALKDGLESVTARSIAKQGHFSTQPIYLEFRNMTRLRREVLDRITSNLQEKTLQKVYVSQPVYDLDLSYLNFARHHRSLFSSLFVKGRFGDQLIKDCLIKVGKDKVKEQFPDLAEPDLDCLTRFNWILVNGMAVMLVDGLLEYDQDSIVNLLDQHLNQHLKQLQDKASE